MFKLVVFAILFSLHRDVCTSTQDDVRCSKLQQVILYKFICASDGLDSALPDAVPPSRSRSPDNSIFVLQVAKSDPKARWTTDHIPDKLRQAFIYLMVPHARIVAGSGKPWASLTISQVQVLFNEVYNRRITKPYKIVPHDVYSTLVRTIHSHRQRTQRARRYHIASMTGVTRLRPVPWLR
ncbi:hypothetical protein K474DRAFT_1669434 [Panus rudis PR-1116 ss-1]|nr:hypothetical protein K474DRAFT_1669434 [Panus rudis PR-1116 ss-1]